MAFGNKDGAYTQLFVGKTEYVNPVTVEGKGEEHYQQGATAPDIKYGLGHNDQGYSE